MTQRTFFLRPLASLVTGAALLVATSGVHAGVIFEHSPNLIDIDTSITASFNGAGSVAGIDSITDSDIGNVVDTMLLSTVVSTAALAPASGIGTAQGDLRVEFEHGVAFPGATLANDLLRIEVNGIASATSALNSAGSPADAVVGGKAALRFFLDPVFGGVAAGTTVGKLIIDAIRPLDPFETGLGIQIRENFTPVATLGPGSAATDVTLRSGSFYEIDFAYGITVPFGTDPPFSFTLDIPILPADPLAQLPAPPTVALLACALVLLGARRAARRAAAPSCAATGHMAQAQFR